MSRLLGRSWCGRRLLCQVRGRFEHWGRQVKSGRFKTALTAATAGVALLAVVVGCSSPSTATNKPAGTQATGGYGSTAGAKSPTNGARQGNNEGSVTVEAQWKGVQGGSLVFGITMNTHAVDLDQYDLAKLTVLNDDSGKEYSPVSWRSSPGGHHREGTLIFPLPDSLQQDQTKYVRMVIKGIAGVNERILQWDL